MGYTPNKSVLNLLPVNTPILDSTEFGSTNPVISGPTDLSSKISSRIDLKLTVAGAGSTTGDPEIIIYVGEASGSLTSMLYKQEYLRIKLGNLVNNEVFFQSIDLPDEVKAVQIDFERFVGADYTVNFCKLATVDSFSEEA